MKNKKLIGWALGGLVILITFGVLITSTWKSNTTDKQLTQAFASATHLLETKRPKEALATLRGIMPFTYDQRNEERASLEIDAYLAMRNIPRLLHLHDLYPHLFLKNEEAALLVCRALLQVENPDLFTTLRKEWEGRKKNTAAWFALDVDAAIVAGNQTEALQILSSTQFKGEQEAVRLTRLALLTAPDNLQAAWDYLEEASLQAPYNSDIRLFRGQILEHLKKPASARVEYVAAHLANPDNPRFRDQLAEFYRRQGNPQLALATWEQGLTPQAPGYLWLKTIFWSRMVAPLSQGRALGPYPEDRLSGLLNYLGPLPETTAWNEEAFFKIPHRDLLLSTRQELFWLRVVDYLSRNQETQALALVERNPFKELSWHLEIEEALMATLRFRKWGVFPKEVTSHLSADKSTHPLFRELATCGSTPPARLSALLKSPEAFSSIFMAGGWLEASLFLHRMPEIPKEFPIWVPYGLTQAFRYNRGGAEALAFAERQAEIPAMVLLKGELLLSMNRTKEGKELLNQVILKDSGVGFRAAWLLTMALLDEGKIDAAKKTMARQPLLAQSLTGRELMARIAVSEEKTNEATGLYTAMADESTEAKVWLSRHAYVEENWEEARRLTFELASAHPDTLQFRANLAAIDDAIKGSTP